MTSAGDASREAWTATVLDGWRRGQRLSAVGPGDVSVHLTHAQSLVPLVGDAERALDLGTGIGIPGLALAGFLPTTAWTLLDAAHRRVRLLAEIIEELGWTERVAVVHARAEEAGRDPGLRGRFDVVIARAFGSPAITAECAAPFVRPGGRIVVSEPPDASASRWPDDGLAALGLERGAASARPRAQVLIARAPVPERFPRRPGRAAKRPMW